MFCILGHYFIYCCKYNIIIVEISGSQNPYPATYIFVHVYGAISGCGPMYIEIFEGIMDAEFFTTALIENNVMPFIRQTFPVFP